MKYKKIAMLSTGRALLGLALGLISCAGMAEQTEPTESTLRLSGFGTLGLLHADVPTGWGYRRDLSQPGNDGGTRADIDTRLGLQLNYTLTPQFELVGQVIATNRSPHAPENDSLEWAFAAYRPTSDITLRVGRVNMDACLMSDYRNVGFATYLSRPPVSFYSVLPTVLDGADVAKVWNLDEVQWRAKVYVGSVQGGDLANQSPIKANDVIGAMVSREADGLLLRATLTSTQPTGAPAQAQPLLDNLARISAMSNTLPLPAVAQIGAQAHDLRARLDANGSTISYAAQGANYERNNWNLSGEITRVSGHPAANFTAAYASIARRLGSVTVFGTAERIQTKEVATETPVWGATLAPLIGLASAQQAQGLAALATAAANSGLVSQRTLSLGMRWDLNPQLALKLQWDRTFISTHGDLLWSHSSSEAGRADITSAMLDFVF
jgi:hypothetical protein